jgi:NAD(P)-dependent dehydrogenase (short-subunit alcohol dehydrogenase family)
MPVAADYATQNIRANCIIVGSVHTPMVSHLGVEARERRRKMIPMQTESYRLGRRPWRGLSCLRGVTLGGRCPAADRRRPCRIASLAPIGQNCYFLILRNHFNMLAQLKRVSSSSAIK